MDVYAATARPLGESLQTQLVEERANMARHIEQRPLRTVRLGIEIDAELVGVPEIVGGDGPGVQLEGTQVDGPQHLADVRRTQHRARVGGGEQNIHTVDPAGGLASDALEVEAPGTGAPRNRCMATGRFRTARMMPSRTAMK